MERSKIDSFLERLIWFLVIALLIIGPLSTGLVRPQDFVLAEWLTLGAVGVWILRIWSNFQYRVLCPPVCYLVVAFVGYALWRYTQAPIEYVARQELSRVMVYAAIFFLIVNNLQRQEATQWVSMVLIFLAMAICFYAVYQFLTKSEKVWSFTRPPGYEGRASGTYINPNHLAGFLEMVLPLALALTLAGRFSVLAKVLIGYAGLAILAGLALTISRGGWVAAVVGIGFLFVFILFQLKGSWLPAIVGAAFLACAALGLYAVAKQADARHNRLSEVRRIYDVRFKLWPAAVSVWKDHLWLGGGPDHFDYYFRKYREPSDQLVGRPGRAHNDYLNTLADWGIVGTTLIASAFGLVAWGFIRGWKYLQRSGNDIGGNRQSTRAAIAVGSAAGLVAILAHSCIDFNMHIPANAITAVSLMAILTGYLRFSTERYWWSSAVWVRLLFTLPWIAWSVFMSQHALQLTREARELAAVDAIKVEDANRLEHLRKAFGVDDRNFKTAYDIGMHFWREAGEGASGYEEVSKQAIEWFARASALNPLDPNSLIQYGMCLDWLDRFPEAKPYFEKALALDPNGFNTVGHMGWHYFQTGEYLEAKKWFEKSQGLYWQTNPLAYTYLKIIERKLAEPKPASP